MLSVKRVDVWSVVIDDQPGGLMRKLEGLSMAGASLQFLVARRLHEEPGKGIVFLTPLTSDKQLDAAKQLGFERTAALHSLRVHGPDEPGISYRITSALTDENINLRGVSAASLGGEFVMYLAFDSDADAQRAAKRLEKAV
jgi:hypothetical protein